MKQTAVMMVVLSGLPGCFSLIYTLIRSGNTWSGAQSYCKKHYTDLATVHNEQDVDRLTQLTQRLQNVWIGLQPDTESWRWSLENQDYYGEGEAEFQMWNASEPNAGSGHYKVCVAMLGNGNWVDTLCDNRYPFSCYNKNASSFIFVNVPKSWEDARSYCREHHTDLASVRSQSENEQLKNLSSDVSAWIGLYRNSWKWSDGTTQSLNNWAANKPSTPVTKSCGAIYGGKWVNDHCSTFWYFICYTVKERKVLKVVLKKSDPSVDMEQMKEEILEQFRQRLKAQGLSDNVKLTWVKQPDGKIFHKKEEEEEEKICTIQ